MHPLRYSKPLFQKYQYFPTEYNACDTIKSAGHCGWDGRSETATHVGRTGFILFGACKRNPFPPHAPKPPKTVMQTVIASCDGFIYYRHNTLDTGTWGTHLMFLYF